MTDPPIEDVGGGTSSLDSIGARPLQPFATDVVALLNDVSMTLLGQPAARAFPDVVTFAFWCRRASLRAMAQPYGDLERRLGRGLVFHIAPSNVPVNFAYSLAAGLLAGNANVVRVPSRDFEQVSLIAQAFDAALAKPDRAALRDHVRLIRYDKQLTEVTADLSRHCDVRVIWGGDDSITQIRRWPLGERAFDVTFADRYSACIIDAGAYLSHDDPQRIAQGFYNDTYLFDQNACTAPHLIVWLGSQAEVQQAQDRFWDELHALVADRYELQEVAAVDKLTTVMRYAAMHAGCRVVAGPDNLISRIDVAELVPDIDEWRGRWGCFFEHHASALEEIARVVNGRYQTLSYFGVDQRFLLDLVKSRGLKGIDRIVPVGRTLDFSLRWDGYDLVEVLSRVIELK